MRFIRRWLKHPSATPLIAIFLAGLVGRVGSAHTVPGIISGDGVITLSYAGIPNGEAGAVLVYFTPSGYAVSAYGAYGQFDANGQFSLDGLDLEKDLVATDPNLGDGTYVFYAFDDRGYTGACNTGTLNWIPALDVDLYCGKQIHTTTFVRANGAWASGDFVPPHIDDVSPSTTVFNGIITVTGSHFGDQGTVALTDGTTLQVTFWSDTLITARAPIRPGSYQVAVTTGLGSNTAALEVTGLHFPLTLATGTTERTHSVSAVFDHATRVWADADNTNKGTLFGNTTECMTGSVVAFNGVRATDMGWATRAESRPSSAIPQRNACTDFVVDPFPYKTKQLTCDSKATVKPSTVCLYGLKAESANPAPLSGSLNYSSSYLEYEGHPGYDYPQKQYVSVTAAATGRVVAYSFCFRKGCGSSGRLVIDHGNNFLTVYAHLSGVAADIKIQLDAGLQPMVDRDTIIGATGETGAEGAPHLHFEVRRCLVTAVTDACSFSNLGPGGSEWVPVDPYGWAPDGGATVQTDPYPTVENELLWDSAIP